MIIRDIIESSKAMYVGVRKITKLGRDRKLGSNRYAVCLPANLNDLWEELWSRRAKVRVYLEIVENSESSNEE